jgi:hypothetical protein
LVITPRRVVVMNPKIGGVYTVMTLKLIGRVNRHTKESLVFEKPAILKGRPFL